MIEVIDGEDVELLKFRRRGLFFARWTTADYHLFADQTLLESFQEKPIMFGFGKKAREEQEAAMEGIILAAQAAHIAARRCVITDLPNGSKFGNLTQIGDLWVNFDELAVIEFSPSDGCGAELRFKCGKKLHINENHATCLQRYIDQQRAEITELETLSAK